MATYISLKQLINGLINDPDITPESLNTRSDIRSLFQNRTSFTRVFLEYLHNANSVHRDNTITLNTIFDLIQNNTDLDNETFDVLFDKIKEYMTVSNDTGIITLSNNHEYFWNESINELIAYFIHAFRVKRNTDGDYEYHLSDELTVIDPSTSREWSVATELLPADAGYSYSFNEEWVIPWQNTNNITFKSALAAHNTSDPVKSVVESSIKTQFTRAFTTIEDAQEVESQWIRLLMPQNNRRVEILDLNRNFWVIGQILSAISTYLFKDDNPISTMFKKLMDEYLQLWENIGYLWLALDSYLNAKHSGVKCWVIPYHQNNAMNYKKYDRQNLTLKNSNTILTTVYTQSDIKNNYAYLLNKYKEYNFIVLPEIFTDSIYPNGYQSIYYPYLLVHYAGASDFVAKKIQDSDGRAFVITLNPNRITDNTATNYLNLRSYVLRYDVEDLAKHSYSYGPNCTTAVARLNYQLEAKIKDNDIVLTKFYIEAIDEVVEFLQLLSSSKILCTIGGTSMSVPLKENTTISLSSLIRSVAYTGVGNKVAIKGFYEGECIIDN